MKKLLTFFCVLSLLAFSCPAALAAAPSITVGDNSLTIKYDNIPAEGGITYILLDANENIASVVVNAGNTWTPEWTEEGLYKVRAYYIDMDGKTWSEESDFTEVRFGNKKGPLYWQDFLDDTSALPSAFTKPDEYFEPTPAPTPDPTQAPAVQTQPQAGVPVYTLAPSLPAAAPTPYVQPTAAPTPYVQPTASYPGTRPCFEHMNIRIRISDNNNHEASVGRSRPGTDSQIVATLNVGEVFQVLDCRITEIGNVHWFMVDKNGTYCWVASGRCERY
ncbi:MAG: SH3 domain-containing protein [Clostridia bacterium]|nr:SH3 domain-containing protein [Clostridia bacterium]